MSKCISPLNTPALSEEHIQAGYISTSQYTKAQIEEAYNHLVLVEKQNKLKVLYFLFVI